MADRIFRRRIYDEMLEWKATSKGSRALLIKGARRVGKSTIVEEFAKREYLSYILINFAQQGPDVIDLFDDLSNIDYIMLRLQLIFGVNLHERRSVIIFDEVQLCPKARAAIKFLVADGRYDYIETGSLLTLRENVKGIVIPSEEKVLMMNPMDFEEFCWAYSDDASFPLLHTLYEALEPIGQASFRKLIEKFRLYLLTGGMPQAVSALLEENNFRHVDEVKREIIELYEADFYKFDPSGRAARLFEAIPGNLSKNRTKFSLNAAGGGTRSTKEEILAGLVDSNTVNISYHVTNPDPAIALSKDVDTFKLFVADTGLFVTLAFKGSRFADNVIYEKVLSGKDGANLGFVFENIVAQMLVAAGRELFYTTFDKPGSTHKYEIDFLTVRKARLVPIEVKSGRSTVHSSLDAFVQKYKKKIDRAYVVYPIDLKVEDSVVFLPVFMTALI